ncbi:hypothetical protein [Saccharothrix stipae]
MPPGQRVSGSAGQRQDGRPVVARDGAQVDAGVAGRWHADQLVEGDAVGARAGGSCTSVGRRRPASSLDSVPAEMPVSAHEPRPLVLIYSPTWS